MSKKILFINTSKLMGISAGVLLVIFCMVGMSFTPEDGEGVTDPSDSTYVTGPRRSHWTTSQTSGSGCNQTTTYTYHHKNDYGKVIAHSLGGGSVSVSGNHTTSASTNSSATAAGTTSYVTWNSNMSPNENTDASSGTEPTEAALIMAHTNEVTFTATPEEGYYFVGWYAEEGCTTQKSDKDHPEYSEEFIIPNYGYTGSSENTQYQSSGSPWTQHRYAKFAVIPGINITFLAPSTPSVNRGTYTVTSQNTTTTISTSNETIEVKGTVLEASLGEAYEFVDWYKRDGSGTETIISTENPSEQLSFLESVSVGVHWRELHNNMNMTFKAVELDGDDNPVGSYTVNSTTVTTSDYVYNTGSAYRFSPTLKATPEDGYIFTGWYIKNGKKKEYLSTESTWTPTFADEITLYAGFAFVGYTDEQKAQFKANGQYFTDLNAANNAAKSASTKTIICTRDGILPPGNYEISSGVTLYIPYSTSESSQTKPAEVTTAETLSAYRTLTFADGANVTVAAGGKICVGGKIMAAGGGSKSAYVTGPCGVINMANGGHIELNGTLYCWGLIKGQDMDQGNNTLDVGTITANAGSVVWEDFAVGDWRGGTATSAINGKKSQWKLFPFQSYSIQNIEVPTTYKYGSTLSNYVDINSSYGTEDATFDIIGSSGTLFLLKNAQSTVRKWYDPTTDLTCYELNGTAQLDELNIYVYISVSSGQFYLPISNSMQIIINCDMTLSKPMTMQAGSVIEITKNATVNLEARLHMFDKDEWGLYIHDYYFRSFNNLTNHKNRGAENSNAGLDDAKLIVDGTLNVVSGKGYIYSTAGGANIMGNGGGKVVFGGALPSGTETLHHVRTGTKAQSYIQDAPNDIAAANLCNEDGSYTKSIASSTFYNVHGRWFTAAAKDGKVNHTYDFTYISSGAVSGTGGTSSTTDAVYSWDKTGLELRQKWYNVTADCNADGHYWWHGQGEQSSWFYNWTLNSDWHQFLPTATEGMYSGSNNKIYTKTDCVWEELGETDVNCLYTIGGVKKALVDGEFIALEPNNNDPAYHAADDATKYYICFSGCNWHEATKYENAEKAYVVDEDIFIWYDGEWMNAEWRDPFFYTLDETDVPIYYEYLNGEWVLSDPYIRVTDGLESRTYWFLNEAFTFASGALRKTPTIKILRDISGITTAVSYTGANKTCTLDLNGHTITGSVTNMITVNAAGCTFYIVDNTTEKKGKINLVFSANNSRRRAFYVQNGHVILNSGTIAATNTLAYSSTNTKPYAEGLLVASGKQFTMNGGRIEVSSAYNPYGIEGASGTPTININGGTIETVAETRDSPYAIFSYGTVNVTNGTINAIAKASSSAMGIYIAGNGSTANISGGAILARATSSAQGVRCWGSATVTGDYNAETPDNTPKSRSYSIMNITGGTITAECTTSTTSYGVLSYGTTNISGGTITSTVQKSNQNTAYGVHTAGGTTTISAGANIIANAPTKAYGVTATGANGDSNRGWPHVGVVNITGGTITANTTNTTTAYALLVTGTTWTINKTNDYSVFNGDYASAGTAIVTGGHFYANAKTTLARGIAVGATKTLNAASATPKCTINGGYYKMTGTDDVLGCNASALAADFQINGGYYSHDGNLATYTPSPKHVLTLASGDANRPPYYYKVAEAYLVTFKNEDGTANIIDPVYQEVGTAPVCSTEPTKESTSTNSFTFDGWATEANGAKVYEPNGLPNVTSAGATYYAHFATTTLKYRVHFDAAANGGECATENIYVNPGTAVGSLPTATKYGYTFNGWYTASTGGTKLAATTVINADADYYAQFTANSHTLTWDLAGGKVSTAGKIGSTTWPAKNATGTPSTSVAFGTILTTIPVVTKTGYTFNRWDPVPTSSMPDENVTYTALWNPNTNTAYTVKHYLQNVDGTYPTTPTETESLKGTTATSVTPDVKSYDGFVSPATQTVTIAAAGTTVVEYRYARRHYTFTLDAYTNGGTSDLPSVEVIHGATIGAVPPDAQKGCNDFTGWYTQPVGGVKITPEFVIEYDMKTLYAQFSDDVRTYPITYLAGAHGTGTVAAGTKTCGEDATLSSSTFTRDGYAQTGWSTTDGGAQAYALGGTYTANASLTLYPVWSAVTYSVRFNKNDEDATGTMSNESFTYDVAKALTSNAFTKTGYNFAGWATSAGGNVVYTDGQSVSNLSATQGAVVDMYAKWTANTYEVALNANGGTGGSTSVTMTYNSVDHTAITNPTKTGYNFHSWNTTTSSSTRKIVISSKGVLSENVADYTGAGGVWIRTTMPTTLYARWSQKSYTTTFTHNGNGSISYNSTVVDAGGTAKVYHVSAKSLVATPNTGYHFTGWTVSGTNASKVTIADLSAASTTITATAASATVTAGFAPDEYTISYKDQGDVTFSGTHADGYPTSHTYGTATTLKTATKTGYTFGGWYTTSACTGDAVTTLGATAYTAAITLYAKWTPNTNTAYTVKHYKEKLEGGYNAEPDETDNLTGTTGAEVTPAVRSYTGFTAPSTQTVTILANGSRVVEYYYTRNSHKVTWDATTNGGSCETAYSMVKHGATIGTLPVATKAGHEFLGWFTTYSGGGNQVTASAVINFDITYYARFTLNNFDVTFDVQGHGTAPDAQSITANGKVTEPADPSAENYRFDGWYKEPACTNAWDFASDVVTATVTLYAKWTRLYTITWKVDGVTTKTEQVAEGTTPSYGDDPTKAETAQYTYSFSGWSPTPYAADKDQIYSGSFNASVHYYTITWKNWNGVTLKTDNLQYGATPSYSGTTPTKTDSETERSYTFKGWSPEVVDVAGEATYTAQFDLALTIGEGEYPYVVSGEETATITTVLVQGALKVPDGNNLTTNDLIIEASADNSGNVNGIERVSVSGNAYFDYQFNVDAWHWSAFGVPFEIDLDEFAPLKEKTTPMVLGTDYDIVYYNTTARAQRGTNKRNWEYVENHEHKLIPGMAYLIAFNHPVGHVNTVRFTKASSAPINYTTAVPLTVTGAKDGDNNWNGIANPKMYHALLDAGVEECQVHDGGPINGDAYYMYTMREGTSDYKFFVGKAAFVQTPQSQSTVEIDPATNQSPLAKQNAPRRAGAFEAVNPKYDIRIAPIDGEMADRLFIRAEEGKEDDYVIVADLAKAGVSPARAQIWVDRYGYQLCKNTTALINDMATYPLGISVPQAGEYSLYMANEVAEDDNLYLTYDGRVIWNLGYAPYVLSLEKGVNEHYGLRLIHNTPAMELDVEQVEATRAAQKMLIDQKVYILRGEQLYSITGQKAE